MTARLFDSIFPSVDRRLVSETIGYGVASAAALVLDTALLYALVSWAQVPYLAAACASFLAGTVFMYWASVRHVFGYRRLKDPRREFSLFLAIGVAGLTVNLVAISAAVELAGAHFLVGKMFAACLTFATNFLLRRWSLFTRRHDRHPVVDVTLEDQ